MTTILAKYVAKHILGESIQNRFGSEDPYFEEVPATRLNGKPSKKMKKKSKALPAGISEHDGKVLTKVKRRAWKLDNSLFSCCGLRFGWSSVIGIIPGIGDVLDAFMAVMVLRTCQKVEGGLPKDVQMQMVMNIVLDFLVGLVPFLGDIADAAFRANTRNAVVLEKYLRKKGETQLKARGHQVPAIDPTDPDEYDRIMREEHGPPPRYTSNTQTNQVPQQQGRSENTTSTKVVSDQSGSAYPQGTVAPTERQHKSSWFGFGARSKQDDVEQQNNPPSHTKSTLQKTRV